jgi:ferredoxin-NADP reductase
LPEYENDVIVRSVFQPVPVTRVVTETAEASSFVLDTSMPYEAGQFVTVRVSIDGEHHQRCYSMSSAPGVDDEFVITVKRVPGGLVSNWLLDHVTTGSTLEISEPAGRFTLGDRPVVAFAAGSGITPIASLLKVADRGRLLYANRDRASTIFPGIDAEHRFDVEDGFVDEAAVKGFLGDELDADCFVCGPTPFMDVVEAALLGAGVPAARIRIERFTPVEVEVVEAVGPCRITIELGGRTAATDHHPGTTILQAARQAGLAPPFSCESGSCATCMARLLDGEVQMHVNNALTDDEVTDGWILTCQSVPTSAAVHVQYEGA